MKTYSLKTTVWQVFFSSYTEKKKQVKDKPTLQDHDYFGLEGDREEDGGRRPHR